MNEVYTFWVDYEDKQLRMVAGELLIKPCGLTPFTSLTKAKWCHMCERDCIFRGKSYCELMGIYRRIVLG